MGRQSQSMSCQARSYVLVVPIPSPTWLAPVMHALLLLQCQDAVVRFACGKRGVSKCRALCHAQQKADEALCAKSCPKTPSQGRCARNGKVYPDSCTMKCANQV